MIYTFSGTGNSRQVALRLAEALGEECQDMYPFPLKALQGLKAGGRLGLVFPVYGWRMPNVVEQFVSQLPLFEAARWAGTYVYAVLTCGDDIGRTDRLLRKALHKRGWPLHAVFSLQCRNTYVCLPGFDVDLADTETLKFQLAKRQMERHILPLLCERKLSEPSDVHPGAFPWLKTYVLGPLFHHSLTSPKRFRVSEACIRCGKCAKACPLGNVALDANGLPKWSAHCAHCLACYHACPKHAIAYGPFTSGKGQVKLLF